MEDKPLTRQQRRAHDRANQDALKTKASLVNAYTAVFMENDPNSEIVKSKKKEVSAKWRMYAKGNRIKPEFHDEVEKACNELEALYKEEIQ